jgi:hypothetical protein
MVRPPNCGKHGAEVCPQCDRMEPKGAWHKSDLTEYPLKQPKGDT